MKVPNKMWMTLKYHTIEFCEDLTTFTKFTIVNIDYPKA